MPVGVDDTNHTICLRQDTRIRAIELQTCCLYQLQKQNGYSYGYITG